MQKIADVKCATAVLQWDQETFLPPKGAAFRGKQISTLTKMAHELFTDSTTGDLLQELSQRNDLHKKEQRNILLTLEDYHKSTRLPADFVGRLTEAVNRSFHAWLEARRENTFQIFREPLNEVIVLKREQASLLGWENHPYDALMDEYDKGLTVMETDAVFEKIRPELTALLDKIKNAGEPKSDFLKKNYPKSEQWEFGLELLRRIHFDFDAGRQDMSEHPFTVNFNPDDVRITTRIDENDLSNMTWSCLHEGGHALYEQGLPISDYGLPLGEYCSLSIHESQSRLWENCIGRNHAFWKHNFSLAKKFFPEQLEHINEEDFFKAINKIKPTLIRTEADEVTYHFHVMIRYELEKRLIAGECETKDIPDIWNDLYKQYLGIAPADDISGCLQDVHWSHGSFGYFATYSIGSLYAAQFYNQMQKENTALESQLTSGNNQWVWNWLRKNIYAHGRYYSSADLCQKITGEKLNAGHFLNYISSKAAAVYGF